MQGAQGPGRAKSQRARRGGRGDRQRGTPYVLGALRYARKRGAMTDWQ